MWINHLAQGQINSKHWINLAIDYRALLLLELPALQIVLTKPCCPWDAEAAVPTLIAVPQYFYLHW